MSYGITGNLKHSNGLLTTYKKRNEYKNLKRRQSLPGYPLKKIFKTKEEIEEYMSGDRITCLICGRSYKSLGAHLKLHEMTSDQYKIEYGLPMSSGLENKDLFEIKSKRFKKMIQEGIIHNDKEQMEINRKKAQEATRHSIRQPFRNKLDAQKLNKHLTTGYDVNLKIFSDNDYNKILEISKETDVHPFDVCEENKGKLPSASMLRTKNRENKDFKKRFLKIINDLPFIVQAAHQMLGYRFIKEVKRLTYENHTNDEMAEILQVNKQTIINCKSKYGFKNSPSNYCHRGHKYENEQRKCYKCDTINRRNRGVLPINIARYTIVDKKCAKCGTDIKAKKMGRTYCNKCKEESYYESQRKYAENNKERRKIMNREARLKRLEKNKMD